MFKTIPLVSASILGIAAAAAASAQTGDSSEGGGIPDVIVTATRQQTSLQTTPIAITAVSSEALAERSLTDTADLGSIVPNATFREAQGAFGKGVTAFIRSIGQADTNLASEPGVAFYIDDMYYPLLFGSQFDLLDLDHVEVLRGPQGTLFGRNALAGAVSLVSKPPDLTQASAYAEVSTGSFDRIDLRGGINLPLSDNMAVRISGASRKRQGYQDRLDFRCEMIRRGTPQLAGNFPFSEGLDINTQDFTPRDCVVGHLGGEDSSAMRASMLIVASDRLRFTISGDWLQDDSENQADQLIAVNPATAAARSNIAAVTARYSIPGQTPFAYDNRFVTGNPYTTYATFGDPIPAGVPIPDGTANPYYNGTVLRGGLRYAAKSPVLNWGYSAKMVWGVADNIDLTVVAGYRKIDNVFSFDVDGSPLALETTRNNTGEDHRSGEVRLSGTSKLIDWVGGIFYYRGHGFVHTALASPYNNLVRLQNNLYEPDSKAAFANATIRPFEKLSFTLGLRYSDDEKPVTYRNRQDASPAGDIVFDVTPQDKRTDWKAGINYQFQDDLMAYISAATGFRLPSFNSRPFQATQVTQIPGDEIVSYELGTKSDFFDRKLRVNADIFYTDYKTRPTGVSGSEYQILNGAFAPGSNLTEPLPGGPAGSTRCRPLTAGEIASNTPGFACVPRTYYTNTPGKVKGFEAEVESRPFEHFSVTGSVGYSKVSAADIDARPVNRRQLGVPYWTGSAGMQYEIPAVLRGGSLTPRLDWFYTGSIANSGLATTYNQPAYSVFNTRFTWDSSERDVSVAVGVTNLFDKFYYRNFFIYQELGFPNVEAQPAPPREWFLTVRKNF
ncbi:MAG: TonB-dependent receptor [Gammaproteobacteria bacterium]